MTIENQAQVEAIETVTTSNTEVVEIINAPEETFVLEGEVISDTPVFAQPMNEINVTEVDFTDENQALAFESVPDLLSLTFATGKDNVNSPILTVTAEGEFQWAPDALGRFDTDDFTNCVSIKHTLLALWSVKGPAV